jgi:hypothetical protein
MKIKNWSWPLVLATILIQVVRYAGAFMSSDIGKVTGGLSVGLTVGMTISGLGMGILDTLGGGLLFNGWRKVVPRTGDKWSIKFKILTFIVFGLVISGLTILVPFTVSRVSQESIVDALGGKGTIFLWFWASMVNLIPYLLIGGVFFGNIIVEGLESGEKVTKKVSSADEQVTRNLPSDWRHVRPTLTDEQVKWLAVAAPKAIVIEFQKSNINISPRTASNWHQNAMMECGMIVKD